MPKQQPAIQIEQVLYGDDDVATIIAIIFDMLREHQQIGGSLDQLEQQKQAADTGQGIRDA